MFLFQISEGWETILLEMDNKLHTYAKQMPDHHGMAADFLELLMLGTPTPELENFLLQELGEKGLKKLGKCASKEILTYSYLGLRINS